MGEGPNCQTCGGDSGSAKNALTNSMRDLSAGGDAPQHYAIESRRLEGLATYRPAREILAGLRSFLTSPQTTHSIRRSALPFVRTGNAIEAPRLVRSQKGRPDAGGLVGPFSLGQSSIAGGPLHGSDLTVIGLARTNRLGALEGTIPPKKKNEEEETEEPPPPPPPPEEPKSLKKVPDGKIPDIKEGEWVPPGEKDNFKGELKPLPPPESERLKCCPNFYFWMSQTNYSTYERVAMFGPYTKEPTADEVKKLKDSGIDALTGGKGYDSFIKDMAKAVEADTEFPYLNFEDLVTEANDRAKNYCPPNCQPPEVVVDPWNGLAGVSKPSEHPVLGQIPGTEDSSSKTVKGPVALGSKTEAYFVIIKIYWVVSVDWVAGVKVHCPEGAKEGEF